MIKPHHNYVIISPCRNEIDFLEKSVASVLAQSVLPAKWVIVDDGSTDGTETVLDSLAAQHSFIEVIHVTDRGYRNVGPGVVEAFYRGLRAVDLSQFEFLCKLDLDLLLPPRYFEGLITLMERNPRLGTCSGKPFVTTPSGRHFEPGGDEMSVGMTKFYRVQCFEEIGGFVREVMWDGIDCHSCRKHGWMARSVNHPQLQFEHLRPMGSSQKSIFTGKRRHGFGQYFMGTGPLYMLASCVYRLREKPFIIGSVLTLLEYSKSHLRRLPQYGDAELRRQIRGFQWRALLLGKRKALAWADGRNGNKFSKL